MAAKPSLPTESILPYPRKTAFLTITALSAIVFLLTGTRLANYDTLYALVWGRQIWHGQLPDYSAHLAPTPHPLSTGVGIILAPISDMNSQQIYGEVAAQLIPILTLITLATIAWLVFVLGSYWVNPLCGGVAAAIVITRMPILDFSARGFFDVFYVALILAALVSETRNERIKPMIFLALAGLWRPEAWVFSFVYLGWVFYRKEKLSIKQILTLSALLLSPIVLWICSDWLITSHPLYSFSDAKHTGQELGRINSFTEIPIAVPRRIGEILREPVLFGAATGFLFSIFWIRNRAVLLGASFLGVTAITVCGFTAVGLPITTRYLLLPAVILSLFCGLSITGWLKLTRSHPYRKIWITASGITLLLLIAWIPWQTKSITNLRKALTKQAQIQHDLRLALKNRKTLCRPYTTPNRRPVPLLALWLSLKPEDILDAQKERPRRGTYFVPANQAVAKDYILDKRDIDRKILAPPRGFQLKKRNDSWQLWAKCPLPQPRISSINK